MQYIVAIASSVLTLIAFALSIPAILSRERRIWFKAHGWIVALSALFMLCLGLYMWFGTLTSRATAEQMWMEQGGEVRSLLQEKVRVAFVVRDTRAGWLM